jgi:hypothetical protein
VSDVPFYQTKMGRQYYDVTMPELVRQLTRLNDMFALLVELLEKRVDREHSDPKGLRQG